MNTTATHGERRDSARPAWRQWLVDIERGVTQSFRGDSSLFGHSFVAILVITMGVALNISVLQWATVLLALSVSVSAEMFQMVLRAVCRDLDAQLSRSTRKAVHIGVAAVVVTRLGALAAIGLTFGASIAPLL